MDNKTREPKELTIKELYNFQCDKGELSTQFKSAADDEVREIGEQVRELIGFDLMEKYEGAILDVKDLHGLKCYRQGFKDCLNIVIKNID